MYYEIESSIDDVPFHRLPRRFETFEEAFEIAKKLADVYIGEAKFSFAIKFVKTN